MVEDEKVLEKIRRLFELAKSSNEHESAAAAAKAQELLQKYNLSISQIPNRKKEAYVKDTVRLKRQVEVFTQTSPESTALIVTSGRELSQAVKHWFPHLRTSYGPTVGAGYGLGQAAGATMGINAGLAGGANSVRRLK